MGLSGQVIYLDSSALVKLVVPEPETAKLFRFLHDWPERVSSALARVEVMRAVRRIQGRESQLRRAEQVLDRLALIRIDDAILQRAGDLGQADLRSLDAIHLATALTLGQDLGALVTYHPRLARAAATVSIRLLAPR